MHKPEKIRNIAIIAHIDHGKTTLLDCLMIQANLFRDNQVLPERMMDSYDQEKERGITIFAKHTGLYYKDYKINIIDTPGHADFSGEVERVLGMVNSVLLLVDAQEGPMPQTRFVLSKSLKMGLRPIVVINKIDRPHANPDRALDLTFDLFSELGANDQQLDFRFCYASGLSGFAIRNLEDPRENIYPLFDLIIEAVPPPPGDPEQPFLMQTMSIDYNDFVGRQACGRILEGTIQKGNPIVLADLHGNTTKGSVTKIESYLGTEKTELEIAGAGDIVAISGMPDVQLGDTLCSPTKITFLPPIVIDEPTVSIDISVNAGPLGGTEGKHVTFQKIRERLEKEKRKNISLVITEAKTVRDSITVAGRGELHLAVLIEAMRREGFEMCLSKPRVIIKEENGITNEPVERVAVEVPEMYSGSIIQELSQRLGILQHVHTNDQGLTTMEFRIPTRGIMGYRNDFLTATRGLGIITSIFDGFEPWKGDISSRRGGALVSINQGKATGYACFNLQERGTLFVKPGDLVYAGMIVGQCPQENDLQVNITREKQLTNVRAAGKDENTLITPPRRFTIEQAINFIHDDELVEITPQSIRLRKK